MDNKLLYNVHYGLITGKTMKTFLALSLLIPSMTWGTSDEKIQYKCDFTSIQNLDTSEVFDDDGFLYLIKSNNPSDFLKTYSPSQNEIKYEFTYKSELIAEDDDKYYIETYDIISELLFYETLEKENLVYTSEWLNDSDQLMQIISQCKKENFLENNFKNEFNSKIDYNCELNNPSKFPEFTDAIKYKFKLKYVDNPEYERVIPSYSEKEKKLYVNHYYDELGEIKNSFKQKIENETSHVTSENYVRNNWKLNEIDEDVSRSYGCKFREICLDIAMNNQHNLDMEQSFYFCQEKSQAFHITPSKNAKKFSELRNEYEAERKNEYQLMTQKIFNEHYKNRIIDDLNSINEQSKKELDSYNGLDTEELRLIVNKYQSNLNQYCGSVIYKDAEQRISEFKILPEGIKYRCEELVYNESKILLPTDEHYEKVYKRIEKLNEKKEKDKKINSKTVYIYDGFDNKNNDSYLDTWLTIKNSRNSSDKWCRYTGSGEFYQYQGKNCNNPVSTRTKRIEEKKALIRERKKKKKVRICQSTFGGIKCKYVWR